MASNTDIANMAFAHLGEKAQIVNISPPDATVHGRLAARYFEPVRDWMLTRFAWSFSTATRALVPLTNDSAEWLYSYAEPTGVLRVHRLKEVGETPGLSSWTPRTERMSKAYTRQINSTGQQALYTNIPNALAELTLRQADPTRFSPGFVMALSYQLAAMFAPPLLLGEAGAKAGAQMRKLAEFELGQAAMVDGAQEMMPSEWMPSNLAARIS